MQAFAGWIMIQCGSDHGHTQSAVSSCLGLWVSLRSVCDPGCQLAVEIFIAGVTQISGLQRASCDSSSVSLSLLPRITLSSSGLESWAGRCACLWVLYSISATANVFLYSLVCLLFSYFIICSIKGQMIVKASGDVIKWLALSDQPSPDVSHKRSWVARRHDLEAKTVWSIMLGNSFRIVSAYVFVSEFM